MRRARSGNLTALLVAVARPGVLRQPAGGPAVLSAPGADFGRLRLAHDARRERRGPVPVPAHRLPGAGRHGRPRSSGLFRRGELYPRAMRFSTIVIALFFAALSRLGGAQRPHRPAALPLPGDLLRVPGPADRGRVRAVDGAARLKVGVALFALPGALHALGWSRRACGSVRHGVRRLCDGAAQRRPRCWRRRGRAAGGGHAGARCCCRRARFASDAGRCRSSSPPALTAGFVFALVVALRPDAGERALWAAPRAAAARVTRGRRARARVLRLDVRDHRADRRQGRDAPGRLRPGAAGAGRLRAGVARRAVPVRAGAGGGRRRRAARAAVRRPDRPARRRSPSGAPSSAGWPTGVGDGTGPDETRPGGGHRRGRRAGGEPHPDAPPRPAGHDQVDAQARHAWSSSTRATATPATPPPTPASNGTAAGWRAAPSTS